MKFSRIALFAMLALGTAAPAHAQAPVFDAANVSVGCTNGSCAAATQAAIAQITASGLTGRAYSDQIALLASALYALVQGGQASLADVGAALRATAAASNDPAQADAIVAAAEAVESGRATNGTVPAFEASPN
ncbi:MAG: hypothetical protein K0B00_03845 [Rhodobacteraceae bacterium]|nr:hypothetical protein [Paracoccaceae bacterium]